VEGQAAIGSQALSSKSVGQAELQAGQVLDTQSGKAELLLTPGVFLRLDDKSATKMISPALTNTEVALQKGRAMIEVDEIRKGNDIRVNEDGASTRLLKTGLYAFDANRGQVEVYRGKAQVRDDDKEVTVKAGHELTLNDPKLKTHKFDKDAFKNDELYKWSDLRSSYLAEANADQARYIVNNYGGPGWFGAGWYWDPFFASYTFIPGDGIFYSPFGWGYYSPFYVVGAPYYGYPYRTVIVPGHDGDHDDRDDAQPVTPRGATATPRPAPAVPRANGVPHATTGPRVTAPRMGGFHSAPMVSHVGGFNGGFHGGTPAHR
jgi:hypothetical protein